MYRAEITNPDSRSFTSLINDWTRLCDTEGDDPFERPEWFTALGKNFKNAGQFLTVRRGGELRAVLPLASTSINIHGYRLRGVSGLFNVNSPRFGLAHGADPRERREVCDAISTALKNHRSWSVLEMRLVRGESWLCNVVERARGEGYLTGTWKMDAAPFIELPGPGESQTFFKGARRHFGRELDRRSRRFREFGSVEFKVCREYSPELIKRFLDLEILGWKGRGGTAAVQDANAAGLHHEFARAIGSLGGLHAYELRLDGRTIAMSLNISIKSTMFHWKTSYDEEYSRYSPGNLLFRRLFEDCTERGMDEIDFLSPATPYKRVWATGEREHNALYIFDPHLVGRLAWAWKFIVINHLRKLKSSFSKYAKLPVRRRSKQASARP